MARLWWIHSWIKSQVFSLLLEHPFIDSIVLEDGTMLSTEEYTHSLIHYDMSAKEIKRLQGIQTPENLLPMLKKVVRDRKIVQPSNQGKILWMNSTSNLSIVDIQSFKATEVNNFWTYCGQKCISIFVTASIDFKRFAGIGLSPDGIETLHVYDLAGGTGFASASINKLFKSSLPLISYESSYFH